MRIPFVCRGEGSEGGEKKKQRVGGGGSFLIEYEARGDQSKGRKEPMPKARPTSSLNVVNGGEEFMTYLVCLARGLDREKEANRRINLLGERGGGRDRFQTTR